jgi:hypothetical protein
MKKHHGQIVERIIKDKGYNITELATDLQVNRRTLYHWFGNQYLKPEIIHNIGLTIQHDFSKEFPELFSTEDFQFIFNSRDEPISVRNEIANHWKHKYLELLEKYNERLNNPLS